MKKRKSKQRKLFAFLVGKIKKVDVYISRMTTYELWNLLFKRVFEIV